jgi:hypothetical protein
VPLPLQVSYTEVAGDTGNRALEDVTFGNIPNVHDWRNQVSRWLAAKEG